VHDCHSPEAAHLPARRRLLGPPLMRHHPTPLLPLHSTQMTNGQQQILLKRYWVALVCMQHPDSGSTRTALVSLQVQTGAVALAITRCLLIKDMGSCPLLSSWSLGSSMTTGAGGAGS
jgi:hypothetical protein